MSYLLNVDRLTLTVPTGHIIQRKKNILNNVSFDVTQGKATAYLGPNGAGKTSTFRILCGLAKANSGQVLFDGQERANGLPPKQFGFMPEQPYFYKNLTPKELLGSLGRLSGLNSFTLNQTISEWAEKLNFSQVLDQSLAVCSKGQIQRVGLAQALIHQPDFILLDEPLSGLDPLGRESVRKVICSEVERGATVLFSSHILADAEVMCENVIVLNQGCIEFSGKIKSLLDAENNWVIRAAWHGKKQPNFEMVEISHDFDGTLRIKGQSEEIRNSTISTILNSNEATLISVKPERRTLEQAFVDLLKGKNNDSSY